MMADIRRLTVVTDRLTQYPLAERVRGGWQNGATFYQDGDVVAVSAARYVPLTEEIDAARATLAAAAQGLYAAGASAGHAEAGRLARAAQDLTAALALLAPLSAQPQEAQP